MRLVQAGRSTIGTALDIRSTHLGTHGDPRRSPSWSPYSIRYLIHQLLASLPFRIFDRLEPDFVAIHFGHLRQCSEAHKCVHTLAYACLRACVYVRVHIDMRACVRACVSACVCACACVYVRACAHIYVYVCKFLCIYLRTYVCMFVCMYACMCVCMFVRMHVNPIPYLISQF